MLLQLVENIEKDLNYISDVKKRLDIDCDVCWSLLCPPGKGNLGKFMAGKSKTSIGSNKSSEECCSESNELYSHVNDLISFGRHIRSDREDQNKRGSMRAGNDGKNSIKIKQMEKTNKNLSIETGRRTILDFKTPRNITAVCSNESNSSEDGRGPGKVSSRHSVCEVVSYSHSCSLKLSGQIISIKMSEDLNNLLSLFKFYADLNSGLSKRAIQKNQNTVHTFSKRFKKKVSLKFENDLKSTNQYEKYMRFVDISEGSTKSKNFQEPPLVIHYKSKEQVELFEKTAHKLLEQQLQSKILNTLLSFLEETHDDSLQ